MDSKYKWREALLESFNALRGNRTYLFMITVWIVSFALYAHLILRLSYLFSAVWSVLLAGALSGVGVLVAVGADLWVERTVNRRSAYRIGYKFAQDTLHADRSDEYNGELARQMLDHADGQFNTHYTEREFDRGVRDAVYDYQREFGAP